MAPSSAAFDLHYNLDKPCLIKKKLLKVHILFSKINLEKIRAVKKSAYALVQKIAQPTYFLEGTLVIRHTGVKGIIINKYI